MITGLRTTFNADYKMGKMNEKVILPKLMVFFGDDSIKPMSQFSTNDFVGKDGTSYEVKSRRNSKTRYDTTVFPVHKVVADSTQYFVFKFCDGIDSYIKFDPVKFATYKTEMLTDGRAGRNCLKRLHYHIPVVDLIDF